MSAVRQRIAERAWMWVAVSTVVVFEYSQRPNRISLLTRPVYVLHS